ncbi:hypothetical protein Mal15_42180 [Stieleria maiorica]|uniref:Shedu protein SduA C-terminal domain-containing protein n=1 Tax=Stieleria maiorica TaxID=2795974 RepID=A0A5B9MG55_9BACT|nr:Shedu anti-phage system protein SduA domain-containing protein [Stieleria maiorica]QEG00149.1 hypothetical protein Mal15_42180 [Stieleria maiorica]
MNSIDGRKSNVLRSRKGSSVYSEATLWKIYHQSGREDIKLKIGRFKKRPHADAKPEPESAQPKSVLTLENDEFLALIDFLRTEYEPFRQGVKAFIPLEEPFSDDNAKQMGKFFAIPDKDELVDFIVSNELITADLDAALNHRRRLDAIGQFKRMLDEDLNERDHWQRWFEENSWVLGSDFVRVLDDRRIDVGNVADYLMLGFDGFLDIIEIKRPDGSLQFWNAKRDHGNYVPSQELVKAITQVARYNFECEQQADSAKFTKRMKGVRTVKPRSTLIFGRSAGWDDDKNEAFRLLNSQYHNLTILTYDHVLARAERIVMASSEQGEPQGEESKTNKDRPLDEDDQPPF